MFKIYMDVKDVKETNSGFNCTILAKPTSISK